MNVKRIFCKYLMIVFCPSCSILVTALLGTVAIFACFSGAAVFAKRREYLFLGAILSSLVSTMLTLRFGSYIFGGAAATFNVEVSSCAW
jgi:hypothetical protein